MNKKNDLRVQAKELRNTLDIKKISKEIVNNLTGSELYIDAQNIMLFYPKKDEIDLRELFMDKTKNFYLPRVNGNNIEVCPYKREDSLTLSSFKVYEPTSDSIDSKILDLIIVPALMADNRGYRLGYGGGYYDRFLKDISCNKVICISDELLVNSLPIDDYDIKCNYIFTPTIKKSLRLRG